MSLKTRNVLIAACLLAAFAAPATAAPTQSQAVAAKPVAAATSSVHYTNRLIVVYKNQGTRHHTLRADASWNGSSHAVDLKERMWTAGGIATYTSSTGGARLSEVMAALRRRSDVASVERERFYERPQQFADPNDPCYSGSSPCDSYAQWGLNGTWGVNAPAAWDTTSGSSLVYVAIIDTGYTDHPDLATPVSQYDFVSTASPLDCNDGHDGLNSNDGDGWDSDAHDPGDWLGDGNPANGWESSWHGTHVNGIIAGLRNNTIGVSGLAPAVSIEHARVLGTCGGYDSDINAAIEWASGGHVSGVADNPHPADVINMSLGGSGSCAASEQRAISNAISRGTTVVVAAGNENSNASGFSPANCNGVITVGASTDSGTRASFSNYGSTVEISAPGYRIWSTLNSGLTTPSTPSYDRYSGTSMATPFVTAAVALLYANNAGITPADALAAAKKGTLAKAFPDGGCDTGGCGSGILDASKFIAYAPAPTVTTPVGTSSGFTFYVTNYKATSSYSFTPQGAATYATEEVVSGATTRLKVTVGNMSFGTTGWIDVTATTPGGDSATTRVTGLATPPVPLPTIGRATSIDHGFTVPLTDFDSTVTWTITAVAFSTGLSVPVSVTGSGTTRTVTVSGLPDLSSATITIQGVKSGFLTKSATTSWASAPAQATVGAVTSLRAVKYSSGLRATWTGPTLDYSRISSYRARISAAGSRTKFGAWVNRGTAANWTKLKLKKGKFYVIQVQPYFGTVSGPVASVRVKR